MAVIDRSLQEAGAIDLPPVRPYVRTSEGLRTQYHVNDSFSYNQTWCGGWIWPWTNIDFRRWLIQIPQFIVKYSFGDLIIKLCVLVGHNMAMNPLEFGRILMQILATRGRHLKAPYFSAINNFFFEYEKMFFFRQTKTMSFVLRCHENASTGLKIWKFFGGGPTDPPLMASRYALAAWGFAPA